MLPLKQYTIEDFYKFYKLVTPLIDKAIEEDPGNAKYGAIRISHHQLREALQEAFPEESNAIPNILRRFVVLMIKEMHCSEIVPCEERTGIYWYDVKPYLNMRELNPEVHQTIIARASEEKSSLKKDLSEIYSINHSELQLEFSLDFINNCTVEQQFGVRTRNSLRMFGITKVSDLLDISADELLSIKHMGKVSLQEIRISLGFYGFWLKDDKEWFFNNMEWRENEGSYHFKR